MSAIAGHPALWPTMNVLSGLPYGIFGAVVSAYDENWFLNVPANAAAGSYTESVTYLALANG